MMSTDLRRQHLGVGGKEECCESLELITSSLTSFRARHEEPFLWEFKSSAGIDRSLAACFCLAPGLRRMAVSTDRSEAKSIRRLTNRTGGFSALCYQLAVRTFSSYPNMRSHGYPWPLTGLLGPNPGQSRTKAPPPPMRGAYSIMRHNIFSSHGIALNGEKVHVICTLGCISKSVASKASIPWF